MAPALKRWNTKGVEGQKLRQLFTDHDKDTSKGADPAQVDPKYIRLSVFDKHTEFQTFAVKNFNATYKRLGREWVIKNRKEGARRE
jgi:hypothetical protein